MPRTVTLAAIQMEGRTAPTAERLDRAATLVRDAAAQGADIVVLPEFFNTGVTYDETNYERTEPLNGATLNWLRTQAEHHAVYLAGSFLLVEHDDTCASAFLVSPDRQTWRYDRHYPLLWERVFFRDGRGLTVADTSLGRIGLLAGWDAAHAHLWERYAAKVDMLLVIGSSQNWSHSRLVFPDGLTIAAQDMGTPFRRVASALSKTSQVIDCQTRWLGIPVVCSEAGGTFRSLLPAPFFSVGAMLVLRRDLSQKANRDYAAVELAVPFVDGACVLAADGTIVAQVADKRDGVAIGEVELPDVTPRPREQQPRTNIPALVYWLVDVVAAGLLTLNYRRGVRRQWGARMAPIDADTRKWLIITALAAIIGWLLGIGFRHRK